MHQIPLDLHRTEAPTLENFVVGGNSEVLARMRLLRDAARGSGPPLVYLWGEHGCGKTHLLRAVLAGGATAHAGRLLGPSSPVPGFRLDGDAPRIVAIDDCDRLDAERQEHAFHLINRARALAETTVVVAGAQPPLALGLREDLRSRLGSGLVHRLLVLDDAQKAEVLQRVASGRGVAIAADVIPWLIAHTSRDIRALLRSFDALDRHAFERKRPITLPLLRELQAGGLLADAPRRGDSPGETA